MQARSLEIRSTQKIQQTKTGEPTENPETNQKSDKRKENSILQKSFIFKIQQRNLESNSSHS